MQHTIQVSALKHLLALGLGSVLAMAATANAGIIATDASIGYDLNDGGTAQNPAQYIFGAQEGFTKDYGNRFVYIGSSYPTADGSGGTYTRYGTDYNQVIVTNKARINFSAGFQVGAGANHNSMLIEDGAQVFSGGSILSLGDDNGQGTTGNSITITGKGSMLYNESQVRIYGTGNNINVLDGGMFKMDSRLWFIQNADSSLNLGSGFLAFKIASEATDNIYNGKIKYLDGSSYEWTSLPTDADINDHFNIVYYETDEEGFAATGYNGLGGYTVVTANNVPEPANFAIACGALATAFVLIRRRNAGAPRSQSTPAAR